MLSLVTGLLSVALYAGATLGLALALRRAVPRPDYLAMAAAALAMILHAVVLYGQLVTPAGLQLGFFLSLSLACWVMTLLVLLLALSQPVQNLGLIVFPLAALALAATLAWAGGGPVISHQHFGLDAHVLISLAAYGVLVLAAIQALVLAFQHRMLHDHHTLGTVRALPPLAVMETLLFRMIGIGFALLTAALATGLVFLDDLFAQHLAHKTVLTILAWLLFALLLGGHYVAGWRGLTAVRLTLGGVILLVLGYSGSKLVLELILERG